MENKIIKKDKKKFRENNFYKGYYIRFKLVSLSLKSFYMNLCFLPQPKKCLECNWFWCPSGIRNRILRTDRIMFHLFIDFIKKCIYAMYNTNNTVPFSKATISQITLRLWAEYCRNLVKSILGGNNGWYTLVYTSHDLLWFPTALLICFEFY